MKSSVILLYTFFLSVLLIFTSCNNSKKQNEGDSLLSSAKTVTTTAPRNNYEIVSEEKSEMSYKAQLIEYVLYKDTVYTEDVLRNTVLEIYNLNKSKDVFDTHDSATVVGVYLFTSKEAMKDKSDWIAMLINGPDNKHPKITFNNFKLTALNDLKDNIKSKDEIELDKLNAYLNERGLELCSLADRLKKLELDNIHKADAKYPDFGEEHMAMTEKLDAQGYKKLRIKYRLSEDIFVKVSIFAGSYCK
jgi:hypothetical protein